jgi:IS30 family transposase
MAQLDQIKRYQIQALLKAEKKQNEIAEILGVSPSTISRELKRNTGKKGYRPIQAQRFADERKASIPKRSRKTPEMMAEIKRRLEDDYSPEQVYGSMVFEGKDCISIESIYQYIYEDKKNGGKLFKRLRIYKPKKKKYGSLESRGQIKDRVFIDERPLEVELNTELGHWEADTVVGKDHKGFLVTLVERKTKTTLIGHSNTKDSDSITNEIIDMLKPYREKVLTITFDNGKEFAGHVDIASTLECDTYFAHPYHSWERGLNENTNGLIRQYFPKGCSLLDVDRADMIYVMDKLNSRPRKTLCFQKPINLFMFGGRELHS